MKLYAAPRTRAVRIVWLLEELGLSYDLEMVEFQPTSDKFFIQNTPTGKIPTLEDGGMVMCESGAILQYILETYGKGQLEPSLGIPERGPYLQWLHYAESSAFGPLGNIVWLTQYRDDATEHPALIADAAGRVRTALMYVEKALEGQTYLVDDRFTAADIMMGFTLLAAQLLGQLKDDMPNLQTYLARLMQRPALQKTMALLS